MPPPRGALSMLFEQLGLSPLLAFAVKSTSPPELLSILLEFIVQQTRALATTCGLISSDDLDEVSRRLDQVSLRIDELERRRKRSSARKKRIKPAKASAVGGQPVLDSASPTSPAPASDGSADSAGLAGTPAATMFIGSVPGGGEIEKPLIRATSVTPEPDAMSYYLSRNPGDSDADAQPRRRVQRSSRMSKET